MVRIAMRSMVVLALLAGRAQAGEDGEPRGGFFEAAGGMMLPLGDDDYENVIDPSFKLGFHGGSWLGKIGIEGAVDWSTMSEDLDGMVLGQSFDTDVNRFRVQLGVRAGTRVGKSKQALVFARFLAGIDISHVSVTTVVLGTESSSSDSDTGLALEAGMGVLVDVGGVAVGGQVAVPFAFHDQTDNNPNDGYDPDYAGYDLDLLFTVSSTF